MGLALLFASEGAAEETEYQVQTEERRAREESWRAGTKVGREELEERLPRSAPDALRYEPGVFVQETAHSQASVFVRGRTGQQTVILFDDVKMNNSVWRQGPNQYFFTVDALTLKSVEVLRGSASTRYGSDAIGGVIHARPMEPEFSEDGNLLLRPRGVFRWRSSDRERGGRAEIGASKGEWGILGGVGYRVVDELEASGPVFSPLDGTLPEVPRFRPDGRTQRGTGFDELTADLALVWKPNDSTRLKLAWYDYRQFDAPRTDACPPAYAPFNECFRYEEQFRDVLYLKWETSLSKAVEDLVATASYQRQHERKAQDRPFALANEIGRDDVDTFGANLRANTDWFSVAGPWDLRLRYGIDGAYDRVSSASWLVFSTVDLVRERSRGLYIDGSTYASGGVWAEQESRLFDELILRAGGRLSHFSVQSPGDEESGTQALEQSWTPTSLNAGLEWWINPWLTALVNVEQGFRAPNLDDLTSRQQTGPGFQFENPGLEPERSLTTEMGVIANLPGFRLDLWAYRMGMENAMGRAPRNTEECPPETPSCGSSWSRFQLVNLEGESEILGVEGGFKAELPYKLEVKATMSWARGEGPSTEEGSSARVPLSRIPPLNGNAELAWRFAPGAYVSAGTRWATKQDRLALQDQSDERIPRGGTPGFAVLDLRAGYRLERTLISASFENVLDVPYRYHGSSVNGAGRGVSVYFQSGF